MPAVIAWFYDTSGVFLESFYESTWKDLPLPQLFSFNAPSGSTITKMQFESTWTVTTFRNISVDNFVLTHAPATAWRFVSGLPGLIGLAGRKKPA
jgi:hypothetical protein